MYLHKDARVAYREAALTFRTSKLYAKLSILGNASIAIKSALIHTAYIISNKKLNVIRVIRKLKFEADLFMWTRLHHPERFMDLFDQLVVKFPPRY